MRPLAAIALEVSQSARVARLPSLVAPREAALAARAPATDATRAAQRKGVGPYGPSPIAARERAAPDMTSDDTDAPAIRMSRSIGSGRVFTAPILQAARNHVGKERRKIADPYWIGVRALLKFVRAIASTITPFAPFSRVSGNDA